MHLVLLPNRALVLRCNCTEIKMKIRKPVLLLVNIMRCSYSSLMTGKTENCRFIYRNKIITEEIVFLLREKCATPLAATAIVCIG